MKETIRILIADDHELFSAGVKATIQGQPLYEVVAILNRGDQVLQGIEEHRPDILILDVNMPGMNGLEVGEAAKKRWPELRVILVTMYSPADIGFTIQNSFADGYLLKDSGSAVLLSALQRVSGGNRYIDPGIFQANQHSDDAFVQKLKLSSREKEILQLIKSGYANKEIAAKLFLSELTIKTHRKNIMSKLGVHNLAELLKKGA
jgi:DNA-binding NarL/FixJ family response regulator